MLKITIDKQERWDSETEQFVYIDKPITLTLEHSLISISKWEEVHHKAFMDRTRKTNEEILDYVRCMIISPQDVGIDIIKCMSKKDMEKINAYIEDQATATHINEHALKMMRCGVKKNNEIMTSELVYYYMVEYGIPAEYQKWRLPRLLTLIDVCNVKEWAKDPKHQKMLNSSSGNTNLAKTYYEINQRRLKQYNTKG